MVKGQSPTLHDPSCKKEQERKRKARQWDINNLKMFANDYRICQVQVYTRSGLSPINNVIYMVTTNKKHNIII